MEGSLWAAERLPAEEEDVFAGGIIDIRGTGQRAAARPSESAEAEGIAARVERQVK